MSLKEKKKCYHIEQERLMEESVKFWKVILCELKLLLLTISKERRSQIFTPYSFIHSFKMFTEVLLCDKNCSACERHFSEQI